MQQKIKVHTLNIDHWFETNEDMEQYRKMYFPNSIKPSTPDPEISYASTLWIDEAVTYLGLDRTDIKRPDKAIHRLIKKGALHPKKISGRLIFSREELDNVLENGDQKKGRGRPKKK